MTAVPGSLRRQQVTRRLNDWAQDTRAAADLLTLVVHREFPQLGAPYLHCESRLQPAARAHEADPRAGLKSGVAASLIRRAPIDWLGVSGRLGAEVSA